MIPEGREILEKMQINLHDSDNRVSDFHYHYHYFWCFLTTHVGPDSLRHVHGRKVEIDISFALQVSRKQHRIFTLSALISFLFLWNCMWRENLALKILLLHSNLSVL